MNLLLIFIGIPLAAMIFISVLYELKLTSVYEYLELRFDSVLVRRLASGIFILQTTILTSVALFAPSIALEAFLGLPSWMSIIGIGICGTIYTSVGGLKAVVWTDVFQFFLIIIGMIAIVARGFVTVGSVPEAFRIAYHHGRLQLFNWNVDPFERYNTLNFLLGYGMTTVWFYGTHQPNFQRYSSLPTFRDAVKALFWTAVLRQLMEILIICTGVSIFASYATCDPILLGEIEKADQIVPYFFVNELGWLPGMMGLFASCIFSAVLSTVSSTLNSLAAVTWEDFLSRIPYFKAMTPLEKGRLACILSALYGLITICLAFIVGQFGSIFQVTMTVIGASGGALGGAFIMGILLPCVNWVGASAGIIMSLLTTGFLIVQAYILEVPYTSLPTSTDGCPADSNFTSLVNTTTQPHYEWPEKLYTISYILYPFIGSVTGVVTGVLVSQVSKFFISEPPESCFEYIHPIIKRLCFKSTFGHPKKNSSDLNKNNSKSVCSIGSTDICTEVSHPDGNGNALNVHIVQFRSLNIN